MQVKACAELVVESLRNSFFNLSKLDAHQISIASARAGNVIGGGDWNPDRLMPDIIQALQNNQVIKVRNPNSVRPWQHVLEPLLGYLILGMQLHLNPIAFSKPFNFGPEKDDHLTVTDVVENTIKNWGSGEWINAFDDKAPHEAALLKLDISRAKSELNWSPKFNASTSVAWTVNWYKQSNQNKVAYTLKQINDYLAL